MLISLYAAFYFYIDAKLAFASSLFGAVFLSPITLWLEKRNKNVTFRLVLIGSCNFYVYFASLGLSHQVSADYYYVPAVILPILLFDSSKKREIVGSIFLPVFLWLLTLTLGSHFLPSNLLASDPPNYLMRQINFIGALLISAYFLWIFMQTNFKLKDLLISELNEKANSFEELSHRLKEAQSIAKTGSWTFDLKTHSLVWTSEYYRVFGIEKPQQSENLYMLYRTRIHPDDILLLVGLVERARKFGEDFRFDHRLIFDGGKRKKDVQGLGKVKFDKDGQPSSISGTCQDRTKQAEMENSIQLERAKAIQASKLASLGEMSAGIAHEINNPLTIIWGNAKNILKVSSDQLLLAQKVTAIVRENY